MRTRAIVGENDKDKIMNSQERSASDLGTLVAPFFLVLPHKLVVTLCSVVQCSALRYDIALLIRAVLS